MRPSSESQVPIYLLPYVPVSPSLFQIGSNGMAQYATALEDLAFPDVPLIVKVIRRSLYKA